MKQHDSDPFPFIQVDRSVTSKAALLAQLLGTTTQHAKGSLIGFWELCAEPRELERIIRATAPDTEPALILDGEEVQLRFHLASGHQVEPRVLERLGFLEAVGEARYRVRGMSRQFEVMEKRLKKRAAGHAGGLASAGKRSANGREAPSVSPVLLQPAQADGKQNGSSDEAAGNTEDRGQRTEDIHVLPSEEVPRVESEDERRARWLQVAEGWVRWASQQAPELARPGDGVTRWAQDFFLKYEPSDDGEGLKVAFCRFLIWASAAPRSPGWGLWLQERVWQPRWDEVRAAAGRRGAA